MYDWRIDFAELYYPYLLRGSTEPYIVDYSSYGVTILGCTEYSVQSMTRLCGYVPNFEPGGDAHNWVCTVHTYCFFGLWSWCSALYESWIMSQRLQAYNRSQMSILQGRSRREESWMMDWDETKSSIGGIVTRTPYVLLAVPYDK